MRTRSRTRDDRGASAVEFALVVPILLVVVFGIINYGVIFSQQLTLNNAVREGARRAVVNDPFTGNSPASNPRMCDGIMNNVFNDLAGLALEKDRVFLTADGPQVSCGSETEVGTAGGTAGSFGANASNIPCRNSDDANGAAGSLTVSATYEADYLVAFPPFPTSVTLTAKAVYQCEFTN